MAHCVEPPASRPGRSARGPGQRSGAGIRTMQRVVLALLAAYKRWISPLLPSACRYHPTCSE
ncbi:MAG: membrane protein insertion efficiency factor YidD, partial [Bryobacteraceae bacterium]